MQQGRNPFRPTMVRMLLAPEVGALSVGGFELEIQEDEHGRFIEVPESFVEDAKSHGCTVQEPLPAVAAEAAVEEPAPARRRVGRNAAAA